MEIRVWKAQFMYGTLDQMLPRHFLVRHLHPNHRPSCEKIPCEHVVVSQNENHFRKLTFNSHYVTLTQQSNIQALACFLNTNEVKPNVDSFRPLFAIQVLTVIWYFMSFVYFIKISFHWRKSINIPFIFSWELTDPHYPLTVPVRATFWNAGKTEKRNKRSYLGIECCSGRGMRGERRLKRERWWYWGGGHFIPKGWSEKERKAR